MGNSEPFPRGIDEIALHIFRRSKSNGMHQRVNAPVSLLQRAIEFFDFTIVGDVALKSFCSRQRSNKIMSFLLQALVLVSDGKLCPGFVEALSNRPGNTALVGHSKNNRI